MMITAAAVRGDGGTMDAAKAEPRSVDASMSTSEAGFSSNMSACGAGARMGNCCSPRIASGLAVQPSRIVVGCAGIASVIARARLDDVGAPLDRLDDGGGVAAGKTTRTSVPPRSERVTSSDPAWETTMLRASTRPSGSFGRDDRSLVVWRCSVDVPLPECSMPSRILFFSRVKAIETMCICGAGIAR